MAAQELLDLKFSTLSALIAAHAQDRPTHPALVDKDRRVDFARLNSLVDNVAASLQRDGLDQGDVVAFCASTSIEYVAAMLGSLRAGLIAAPLSPLTSGEGLAAMITDCDAKLLFLDGAGADALGERMSRVPRVSLDNGPEGMHWKDWIDPGEMRPRPVSIAPGDAFNIIYSSGTTGTPKGIILTHGTRWGQMRNTAYDAETVSLISTPLYSNITLVSLLPTLHRGGTAVLLPKFDAGTFLRMSALHGVTHAMLVPVQFERILGHAGFDQTDLSAYRLKLAAGAPFAAAVKAEVVKRWPGELIEFYGTTEGGGTCVLRCTAHPDKLGSVGQPLPGHDIRIIDDFGSELPAGQSGEVVGRSEALMMKGYHNQPDRTSEAEWFNPEGVRYLRTGDIGRFDDDGFLYLMDRKKDMIISGGFNVYPSDIEAVIASFDIVQEVAVVGARSAQWGESPVAFVALKPERRATAATLLEQANARLGKTQRLADLHLVDSLPRNQVGKVLKRDLRDLLELGEDTR